MTYDDGYDDDLDLIADCMDETCAGTSTCAVNEVTGSLAPGVALAEPGMTVDVWEVVVTGAISSSYFSPIAAMPFCSK